MARARVRVIANIMVTGFGLGVVYIWIVDYSLSNKPLEAGLDVLFMNMSLLSTHDADQDLQQHGTA